MSAPLRVLVVDDEPPARLLLGSYLRGDPEVQVVGMCGTVEEAVAHLAAGDTDAVFLDIQLSDGTGFDVLDRVGADLLPMVVFVTAYDEHAVRAFEVSAIDYLLKPVGEDRFLRALARLKERFADSDGGGAAKALEAMRIARELLAGAHVESAGPARGYLAARTAGGVRLIPLPSVHFLSVDGHQVTIHTASETHRVRGTLADFEADLDAERFVRIHRSTIVNLDFVRELKPWFRGDYLVLLHDGTELRLSRRYRGNLSRRLASEL